MRKLEKVNVHLLPLLNDINIIDEMLAASCKNFMEAEQMNSWFKREFIDLLKGDAMNLPVKDKSIEVATIKNPMQEDKPCIFEEKPQFISEIKIILMIKAIVKNYKSSFK